MKRLVCLLVPLLLTLGCGFTPESTESPTIEKVRHYQADYDTVWKTIISVFAEINLPLEHLDKDSGYISTRTVTADRSWIHAPEDTIDYKITSQRGSFNVFVDNGEDGCTVTINAIFNATEEHLNVLLGSWSEEKDYPSSGTMENRLHKLLLERLEDADGDL